MEEEDKIVFGVLQVPESYPALGKHPYHVFYSESRDQFFVTVGCSAYKDILENSNWGDNCGTMPEYINTIYCRDSGEATVRCIEIEKWHRDGWAQS